MSTRRSQRGRITRSDAADLVTALLAHGRGQADDLLSELEQLFGRAPFEAPRGRARPRPSLPISGYDDLTAAEIVDRLDGMSATDLRKVREYERATRTARPCSARRAQAGVGACLTSERGRAQTSTRPVRGAELELTVDSLAHGGNGVARLDGYVVFVAGALPGDRVRAVVGKSKRAYAEARAVEILEPSPDRIPPRADHPGAPWQVLAYERQLEVKAEQVGDALRRIGKLDGFEQDPIVPAVEQWRYRNKLEYSFGTGPDGELVCGFHAPGRCDEIVPLDDCLLASERGNAAREQVLAWCREQGLRPGTGASSSGLLRNLVVREGRRTGELQVRLVTSPGAIDTDALAAAVDCEGLFWTQPPASARARRAARPSAWPAPSGCASSSASSSS